MDLRTLARYPFLREAGDRVKGEGIGLDDVLTDRAYDRARVLGYDRALAALEQGRIEDRPVVQEADALNELLSYPVARMIVSAASDTYLTRRYAIAEAKLAHARLLGEDPDFLLRVAGELGVTLTPEDGAFRLHFADFLRFTNTMREKEWKLINQRVADGFVLLPREKGVRVLQNAVQRKIDEELPLDVNDAIVEALEGEVREVRRLLREKHQRWRAEDVGSARITRFPPCMYQLLAAIQNHENVAHMGRFAIVTFLHHAGLSNEEIFRVFGDVPDFAADVTKYQIGHITGESSPTEYSTPECATMKSYGLCPGPDALCLTIKHPLQYYRKKSRMDGGRRATAGPPDTGRASPPP
ncbi:MAG TPA: DNA primase large subunit PriL [Thermoplasmata archaeon]|nr:DNA primase large subunit PriL [Thermoplasmata archaeon]